MATRRIYLDWMKRNTSNPLLTNKGRFVEGGYIDWHKTILGINTRIQCEFRRNTGLCNGLTGLRIALYSPRRCWKNGIDSGQIFLFGIQNSNGNFAFGRNPKRQADLWARAQALLAQARIERVLRGKPYDLRPLIQDLRPDGDGVLVARLSTGERANARADELIAALGLALGRVCAHRRRLFLSEA